jgi:signal transduction histidine kinase
MSWITIIGSMSAGCCMTLAAVHLLVWLRTRDAWGSLLFSISAAAAAAMAALDLLMLRAHTPAEFGELLRWLHVPVWVMIVSVAWFYRFYLGTARTWLLWAVCGARTLALVLNFLVSPNLNFREITALRQIPLLGETVSVPVGVVNPWTLVGQGSLLLLLVYFADTAITAWRKGSQGRRSLAMGGALTFSAVVAVTVSVVVLWFQLSLPYVTGVVFLGVVLVMAYGLSGDLLRAAQLSRRLRETEDRMSLAAAAADIAMWEWDIVKDEFWTSDRCRTRLVIPGSERLDSKRFLQLLHPEDREQVSHALAASISGDGNYNGEHRVALPSGEVRWISAAGRVEYDAARKPLRVRGISVDVTRLKQAELLIHKQRDELRRVSRKAMLGEFSALLAHELNQPLGAILCNAEAARHHLSREPHDLLEVRTILADIVAADRRASEIIQRLRLLFRQGSVQMQPVDLNAVVRDLLKLLQRDMTKWDVDLDTELARELPAVNGDPVQLQQVLLNLVTNACNAMADAEPKGRKLRVRTASSAEGVCVTIADRGRGIPPESLTRIFDSFYTTRPEGMGLGLTVCRTIIEAHHGRLWAENNSDGGASFHFTLPAVKASGK